MHCIYYRFPRARLAGALRPEDAVSSRSPEAPARLERGFHLGLGRGQRLGRGGGFGLQALKQKDFRCCVLGIWTSALLCPDSTAIPPPCICCMFGGSRPCVSACIVASNGGGSCSSDQPSLRRTRKRSRALWCSVIRTVLKMRTCMHTSSAMHV